MKKNKAMAVISWIISVVAILSAVLISEGNMSKKVIFNLRIAAVWLIIGIIYWKKRWKER